VVGRDVRLVTAGLSADFATDTLLMARELRKKRGSPADAGTGASLVASTTSG
jgi:hypothetical protein